MTSTYRRPDVTTGSGPKYGRSLLWLLGVSITAAVGFAIWQSQRPASSAGVSFPLPPYSASPYLNTGLEAQYVGTDSCASCHRDKHKSYLLTPHSRALADLDPSSEPPDGSFYHESSSRFYRVYRQDGQFRHEEIVRTAEGKEISRLDVPIRYLVGS